MKSHAADLELARRCADGDPAAWDAFVLEYRPVLYRAADALDATGRAREIADSLYAELYGIKDAQGQRQSLLRYFEGRSSLATWLRAVLAQRFVDCVRKDRRVTPLPPGDEDVHVGTAARPQMADAGPADPERPRYLALIGGALRRAVARLRDKDRLRLGCYYAQELTLAETGRVLREHEATVSRQLARTRRAIREDVERELRENAGLTEVQVAECVASVSADPGPLDLMPLFGSGKPGERARERAI